MASVVAAIPARSGSKGVSDKNIKLLSGRPLLAYSIMAALLARNIDHVIVSTDSEHYAKIAREYGAEVPFLRPPEISGDNNTDYEWIKHALDWMQDKEGSQPDYLVNLRPTTPLREVSYIDAAIDRIKKADHATALRSVHEMPESAYKTVEIENGHLKCICTESYDMDIVNLPRQGYPKTYKPNGYVDIIKSDYVREHKKLFGDLVIAYITPRITEVDGLEDYDYLEYQVDRNPEIVNRLFKKREL